ncbi:MAG: phosphomethylpyrimidine synthase ThiC [bacterium]
MEKARRGRSTDAVRKTAKTELVVERELLANVACGRVVIPLNKKRRGVRTCGIGAGLSTKVNANIGSSRDKHSVAFELAKLREALKAGADTVMDLSTGGDVRKIRRAILENCPVPLGTVPVYEAFVRAVNRAGETPSSPRARLDPAELFDVIEQQADDGVDFMTVHAGLTAAALERLSKQKRVTGIVSRGGALLASWMKHSGRENPLYEHFDRVLEIAKKHDVTLSLGDGLRSGCLDDAHDRAMVQEMIFLGELAQLCLREGVQAIIEGPGHMPLDQIAANVKMQKSLCGGAPYYLLGPLVTDVAPGYDHITSAIGGAAAAAAGADFLCYVTPSEHLGLPTPDDVRLGVIASRIAAHAADVCKLGRRALDTSMSAARKALDWRTQENLAIDPAKFALYRENKKRKKPGDNTCSMCGEYCAYLVSPE